MNRVDIPLSNIDLSDLERKYGEDALRTGWISGASQPGQYLDRAEKAFATFCGAGGCTLVSNGTAALHLALMCMKVKPGDEVIVPGMTFVSPAAVVARMGAIPVIADVEESTWCISPGEVSRLATERTRGVIAVDVLGHPADYQALRKVCQPRNLFLVEDAAQAHGSASRGHRTGSLGDMATFSFFANKTLNCGEGGAVLSSNPELMTQARLLKNHGMTKERPYWHDVVGDNFRLSNLHAAILLGQIERADAILQKKRRLSRLYREGLADVPGLAFRPCAEWADVVTWLEPLQVLSGGPLTRDELVQQLNNAAIQARPLWSPLAKLPVYAAYGQGRKISTPVSERLLGELLWLPSSSVMTDAQIEKVVGTIRSICGR